MSGIVTGAAVVGMKFDGGVLLAADTKCKFAKLIETSPYRQLWPIK